MMQRGLAPFVRCPHNAVRFQKLNPEVAVRMGTPRESGVVRASDATERRDWLGVVVDGLDEGLMLLAADGAVVELNTSAEKFLAASLSELIGHAVKLERAPGASAQFVELLARAVKSAAATAQTLRLANGTWVHARVKPAADGFAVFMTDVTESQSSSTQADDLRLTLDRMGEAFSTLDANWHFTFVNAAAEQLLHTTREALLGEIVWVAFPAAVGTIIETEFVRARDTGAPTTFEVYFAPLESWFEVRVTPSQGGIAVHFRDFTQRKAGEERLIEQATLLDHAQDAIVVRDLEHRIKFWNKGAERCYGWTSDDVIGKSTRELLYLEADYEHFDEAVASVMRDGEWRGDLRHRTRDGRTLVMEARWSLMRDGAGKPRSVLTINSDVTEKKNLEKQFLRAQRMESLGTLAGGIAHDLNNVLAPIVMTASSLHSDEQDPERAEDLAALVRSAERGADMVRQLLSFARGADGQRSPVELKAVVMDVQQMLRDTFPKNIAINVHVAPRPWTVEGDRTQLNQMLTNLCVNARDAMPLGGTLSINVEHVQLDDAYADMNLEARPGPYVLMRVEDTGSGMSPEVLEHVFEPFFTTKDVGKGTGLGLSTVHALVRAHHGFVHVYSELGRGTRFKIYLPAQPARNDSLVARAPEELERGNGELILVIDDEAPIRAVARRTLERHGYRVMLASNGAEAVALFAVHRKDIALVLTDMTMPVMDGPATILALRSIDADVRIVGSSGLAANGNVARAVDAGVKYFVPKPYTAEVMLKVLRKALS